MVRRRITHEVERLGWDHTKPFHLDETGLKPAKGQDPFPKPKEATSADVAVAPAEQLVKPAEIEQPKIETESNNLRNGLVEMPAAKDDLDAYVEERSKKEPDLPALIAVAEEQKVEKPVQPVPVAKEKRRAPPPKPKKIVKADVPAAGE